MMHETSAEHSGQLPPTEPLAARCRSVVTALLDKEDWRLAEDREAFVAEVTAEAERRLPRTERSRAPDQIIRAAAVNRYNHRLYFHVDRPESPLYERALTELGAALYKVCLLFTHGGREIAQDVAQEALVATWKARATLNDPGTFIAFARTIALRSAIRQLKKMGRELTWTDLIRPGDDDSGEPSVDAHASTPGPEQSRAPSSTEFDVVVRECLKGYLAREEAFLRRHRLGQSIREIAAAMGRSETAVWGLIYQALGMLRNCKAMQAL